VLPCFAAAAAVGAAGRGIGMEQCCRIGEGLWNLFWWRSALEECPPAKKKGMASCVMKEVESVNIPSMQTGGVHTSGVRPKVLCHVHQWWS